MFTSLQSKISGMLQLQQENSNPLLFDLILSDLESITWGNSVGQLLLSTGVCPEGHSKPSVTHRRFVCHFFANSSCTARVIDTVFSEI